MKEYDKKFNKEIEAILNKVYNTPLDIGGDNIRRAIIKTEKRYIDYLEEKELIKRIPQGDGDGKWAIQLERKGFEVFEKYNGWHDYKKQVIDKVDKAEKAKSLAQRFWWIPIAISTISLIVAIIALVIKRKNG